MKENLSNQEITSIHPEKFALSSEDCFLNCDIYRSNVVGRSPALIMLHGYPGGEGDPLKIGTNLSKLGINVIVFNFRGTWSSEGEFSFDNSIEDVNNVLTFLTKDVNAEYYKILTTNIVVGGWSYGGAIALLSAIHNPRISRIISIAGADESVFGRMIKSDPEFRKSFSAMLEESIYPHGTIHFDLKSQLQYWLTNLDKYDLVKQAYKVKDRDIFLIGGQEDRSIEIEKHILPFYEKLQLLKARSVKLEILDTDHNFSNCRDELYRILSSWIKIN